MKFVQVAVLALLGSCTRGSSVAQEQRVDQLRYAPDTVEVRGTLVFEQQYGPPGYGEDTLRDLRLSVPVLRLGRPISVVGDTTNPLAGDPHSNMQRIQLTALPQGTSVREFENREVVVTGRLLEAVWGREYTPVVIEVIDVRRGP